MAFNGQWSVKGSQENLIITNTKKIDDVFNEKFQYVVDGITSDVFRKHSCSSPDDDIWQLLIITCGNIDQSKVNHFYIDGVKVLVSVVMLELKK